MSEKLIIKNFAMFKHIELEPKPITLVIGDNASGKSLLAKILYFCRKVPDFLIELLMREDKGQNTSAFLTKKWTTYIPKELWGRSEYEIVYISDNSEPFKIKDGIVAVDFSSFEIAVDELRNKLKGAIKSGSDRVSDKIEAIFVYSELLKSYSFISKHQVYIPAGRSYFSQVNRDAFAYSQDRNELFDAATSDFGRYYASLRRTIQGDEFPLASYDWSEDGGNWTGRSKLLSQQIRALLNGNYEQDADGSEYIRLSDSQRLPLSIAASSQQVLAPLLLPLVYGDSGLMYIIEEPEAHLFPANQRKVIELLIFLFNIAHEDRFEAFITTHSHYVFLVINNLIEAWLTNDSVPSEEKSKINQLVGEQLALDPKYAGAFQLKNGELLNLYDPETGLLMATPLDEVSDELAEQFDRLMDIKYADQKA